MLTRINKAFRYLMDNGIRKTTGYGIIRLSEMWNERYFSIVTSKLIELDKLGIKNPECLPYIPISYSSFKALMKHVEIEKEKDVFVDYGAGKGRVVVLASTYPFKRVIGVELVPELAAIARENVSRAAKRLRCPQIEIVIAEASEYYLPEQTTIIHFYNPFRGKILSEVAHNIKTSLLKFPRPLTILFANPDDFERILAAGNSIPSNWIVSRQDVLWPHCEHSNPDANRYRIYRIHPQ